MEPSDSSTLLCFGAPEVVHQPASTNVFLDPQGRVYQTTTTTTKSSAPTTTAPLVLVNHAPDDADGDLASTTTAHPHPLDPEDASDRPSTATTNQRPRSQQPQQQHRRSQRHSRLRPPHGTLTPTTPTSRDDTHHRPRARSPSIPVPRTIDAPHHLRIDGVRSPASVRHHPANLRLAEASMRPSTAHATASLPPGVRAPLHPALSAALDTSLGTTLAVSTVPDSLASTATAAAAAAATDAASVDAHLATPHTVQTPSSSRSTASTARATASPKRPAMATRATRATRAPTASTPTLSNHHPQWEPVTTTTHAPLLCSPALLKLHEPWTDRLHHHTHEHRATANFERIFHRAHATHEARSLEHQLHAVDAYMQKMGVDPALSTALHHRLDRVAASPPTRVRTPRSRGAMPRHRHDDDNAPPCTCVECISRAQQTLFAASSVDPHYHDRRQQEQLQHRTLDRWLNDRDRFQPLHVTRYRSEDERQLGDANAHGYPTHASHMAARHPRTAFVHPTPATTAQWSARVQQHPAVWHTQPQQLPAAQHRADAPAWHVLSSPLHPSSRERTCTSIDPLVDGDFHVDLVLDNDVDDYDVRDDDDDDDYDDDDDDAAAERYYQHHHAHMRSTAQSGPHHVRDLHAVYNRFASALHAAGVSISRDSHGRVGILDDRRVQLAVDGVEELLWQLRGGGEPLARSSQYDDPNASARMQRLGLSARVLAQTMHSLAANDAHAIASGRMPATTTATTTTSGGGNVVSITLKDAIRLREALRKRYRALRVTHSCALDELRRREAALVHATHTRPPLAPAHYTHVDTHVAFRSIVPEPYWYEKRTADFHAHLSAYKDMLRGLDALYFGGGRARAGGVGAG